MLPVSALDACRERRTVQKLLVISGLAIATLAIALGVPTAGSAGSPDVPRIVPWHQVGAIGIGFPRARIVSAYGRPSDSPLGALYSIHGGHVLVGYDRSGHVDYIEVETAYYKAANGFGVGFRIPLGVCHRRKGSCTYTWDGLSSDEGQSWYRSFVWRGARMQVQATVNRGVVQWFSISKLGSAGVSLRAPAGVSRAIVAATLHEICGGNPCKITVTEIRLAQSDPSYAADVISNPRVGSAVVLLHRVRSVWRVVDYGSAHVGCGEAPKKVLDDLGLYCS